MEIKKFSKPEEMGEFQPAILSLFNAIDSQEQGFFLKLSGIEILTEELKAETLSDRWETGYQFAVAFVEDVPVGFVEYTPAVEDSGALWMSIHYLVVDSTHRNQGVGRALVDFVRAEAREENVTQLTLSVNTLNHEAMKFYAKLGFAETIKYLGVKP